MELQFPCYAVIPARFGSTRFPGKPLADICGRPMFWHVYSRVAQCPFFRRVVLATDDERIRSAAERYGVPCVMTASDHPSGTDRVHEAAGRLGIEADAVVVNVQGDEPALNPDLLSELIAPFTDPTVVSATLAAPISSEAAASPHQVKVVTAENGDALYFSRSPIPFPRDADADPCRLGHIGIYAFRMAVLDRFVRLPPSRLERTERLEQLRLLENGIPMRVVCTAKPHVPGVDTPADLERVRALPEINQQKCGPFPQQRIATY